MLQGLGQLICRVPRLEGRGDKIIGPDGRDQAIRAGLTGGFRSPVKHDIREETA